MASLFQDALIDIFIGSELKVLPVLCPSVFFSAVAEIYASITISAWEKCDKEEVRSSIETDIIQDLMYSTIHIQKSGAAKALNALLMKVCIVH